eukprot:g526.t1
MMFRDGFWQQNPAKTSANLLEFRDRVTEKQLRRIFLEKFRGKAFARLQDELTAEPSKEISAGLLVRKLRAWMQAVPAAPAEQTRAVAAPPRFAALPWAMGAAKAGPDLMAELLKYQEDRKNKASAKKKEARPVRRKARPLWISTDNQHRRAVVLRVAASVSPRHYEAGPLETEVAHEVYARTIQRTGATGRWVLAEFPERVARRANACRAEAPPRHAADVVAADGSNSSAIAFALLAKPETWVLVPDGEFAPSDSQLAPEALDALIRCSYERGTCAAGCVLFVAPEELSADEAQGRGRGPRRVRLRESGAVVSGDVLEDFARRPFVARARIEFVTEDLDASADDTAQTLDGGAAQLSASAWLMVGLYCQRDAGPFDCACGSSDARADPCATSPAAPPSLETELADKRGRLRVARCLRKGGAGQLPPRGANVYAGPSAGCSGVTRSTAHPVGSAAGGRASDLTLTAMKARQHAALHLWGARALSGAPVTSRTSLKPDATNAGAPRVVRRGHAYVEPGDTSRLAIRAARYLAGYAFDGAIAPEGAMPFHTALPQLRTQSAEGGRQRLQMDTQTPRKTMNMKTRQEESQRPKRVALEQEESRKRQPFLTRAQIENAPECQAFGIQTCTEFTRLRGLIRDVKKEVDICAECQLPNLWTVCASPYPRQQQ